MDGLTFTAEIVKAVVWPATAVTIVLLLRKPLGKLVPLLRRLKWGDVEAEFGELLEEAKKDAADLPKTDTAPKTEEKLADPASALVDIAPSAAVVVKWNEIEHALQSLMRRFEPDFRQVPAHMLRGAMKQNTHLTDSEWSLFDQLRKLRNVAAHHVEGVEISEAAAVEYIDLANRLIAQIRARL